MLIIIILFTENYEKMMKKNYDEKQVKMKINEEWIKIWVNSNMIGRLKI